MIETDEVRPSVEDVALLERTRTTGDVGLGGDEGTGGTFTETTNPTASDVEHLIDLAMQYILPRIDPVYAVSPYYPVIKLGIAIQAAIFIETSFFRETADLN